MTLSSGTKISTKGLSRPFVILCGVLWLLGLLMYANALYEAYRQPEPWFDDAFMYIRYAENINAGNGYCWNKEESPLYGCTNITHAYLIAAGKKLFPAADYATVAIWLPVINYGVIVLALCFFVARYWKLEQKKVFAGITFTVIALLLNPFLLYHVYTGMDTILSFSGNTFLIMALLLLERKKTVRLALTVALASWFSWFLRPDNIFYSFLFPALFMLFRLWGEKKIVFTYIASFLFLITVDTCIKHFVFHEVLPLSFYVKSSGFFNGYMGISDWNPLQYLLMFIAFCWLWILLLSLFYESQYASNLMVYFLPVFLTLVYFFDAIQMMGTAARFYVPSIPFLLFAALELYFSSTVVFARKYLTRVVIVFLFFGSCIFWADALSEKYNETFLQSSNPYTFASQQTSSLSFPIYPDGAYDFFDLCTKLPAGTKVAAGEHGRLAAYNPQLSVLDLYGLHNSYFAHNGFSADYLFEQKPDVIQLAHYNFTKINSDIVGYPHFKRDYDFYPSLYGYGVAVRKENDAVRNIFETAEKVTYDFYSSTTSEIQDTSATLQQNKLK